MKKLFYIAAGFLFFGVVPHVLAASGFVPLAGIPGLTQNVDATQAGLASFFNNLYKYLIGVAAVLAVIQIIWSGIKIAFNQDNVSTITDSKGHITQAILGLVLVLSPVVVFSIINPSILNLSLNLPPINLATSTPTVAGNATQTTTPDGCTVTGTLLKKASCPTSSAAQNFVATCDSSGGSGTMESCKTENSTGCTSGFQATCSNKTGPFVFLDTSYYLNPVQLFSNYKPLAYSASNKENGSQAVQFAATCTQDGGVTCISGNGITGGIFSTSCTYTSSQSTSQTNKCYSTTLSCKPSSFLTTLNTGQTSWLYVCSGSPSWTPIP